MLYTAKMRLMMDIPSAPLMLSEWEQQIGDAVRQLRIDAGYDQTALADRANVSRSAVQALEQGKGSRLLTVLAVLRALDRLDVFDAIMPLEGPTPLEALAAARRAAGKPQRHRTAGG